MVHVSSVNLFTQGPPRVDFYPQITTCQHCGVKLSVQKTRQRTLVTLPIGPIHVRETLLQCPNDGEIYCSEELRNLAPARCTFGYDVMVYVGKALFVRCFNTEEIQNELAHMNIEISDREIAYLGKKFIIYLALAHRGSVQRLRQAMIFQSGYILHVDGTCEGDSPHFFTGLDEIAEIVLDTITIPSEKAESLIPFFQRLKSQFGDPLVVVHDMGKGILQAVQEVFPNVVDLICHFHFLRDIGKDLLDQDYSELRNYLKKEKVRKQLRQKAKQLEKTIATTPTVVEELKTSIENAFLEPSSIHAFPAVSTYALIHWIFETSGELRGYGFPFDRTHLVLYQRLRIVRNVLQQVKTITQKGKRNKTNPFHRIWKYLEKIVNDQELQTIVTHLEEKAEVFDKLRSALSIALFEGKRGLNDDGQEMDIKTVEQKVTEFRAWITSNDSYMKQKGYSKMVQQIDKYWEKLFADPIVVNTPEGDILIQPQRTNNILERFFRDMKRKLRKKNGNASLNKTLKSMLEDTPLVQNLHNDEYVKIILNGCKSLEERFAKIDNDRVVSELKKSQNQSHLISPQINKLIKNSEFPQKIEILFTAALQIERNRYFRS